MMTRSQDSVLKTWIQPCLVLIILIKYDVSHCADRGLCPTGWHRCSNNCYKILEHAASQSFEEITEFCKGIETETVANLSVIEFNYNKACFTSYLSTSGLQSTLIALNDIVDEDVLTWGEYDFFPSDWDEPDRSQHHALTRENTEELDCVEALNTGQWKMVACDGEKIWTSTVCQARMKTGLICDLNGDLLVL